MDAFRATMPARGGGQGLPRRLARAFGLALAVVAWGIATAVGLALAFLVAAGILMAVLLAVAPLAVAVAAMRASRRAGGVSDPGLLEARHLGGHSWVAYAAEPRR